MLPREIELVPERTGLSGVEVYSALSGPTDWILRHIETYHYLFKPVKLSVTHQKPYLTANTGGLNYIFVCRDGTSDRNGFTSAKQNLLPVSHSIAIVNNVLQKVTILLLTTYTILPVTSKIWKNVDRVLYIV